MDSAAQHMIDGSVLDWPGPTAAALDRPGPTTLAQSAVPDLTGFSLAELAEMAGDDDDAIRDVVARMVDGMESPSLVQAMIFQSAI